MCIRDRSLYFYVKWLANCSFNRSLMQQSKQRSMRAYPIRLNCRWWLTPIQILQAFVVILWRPNHLLMSSVVGWKRSRRRLAWNTTRCPGITQKFAVCRQHLLAKSMKVPCSGPNRQTRFCQRFQRSRSLSVGLRPPSWLLVSQYKFSREKFTVCHFKSTFWAY